MVLNELERQIELYDAKTGLLTQVLKLPDGQRHRKVSTLLMPMASTGYLIWIPGYGWGINKSADITQRESLLPPLYSKHKRDPIQLPV